jgi:transcriptional regulator with XRE-family HTH domain
MDFDQVMKALGYELTVARHDRGLSQEELSRLLQDKLGVKIGQTGLLTYEKANREITVRRLLELAEALDRSAPVMLTEAIYRADRTRCWACGCGGDQ